LRVKCHHLHLHKSEVSKGDRVGQKVDRHEDRVVGHRNDQAVDLRRDRSKGRQREGRARDVVQFL
jgi:hypothetical protein